MSSGNSDPDDLGQDADSEDVLAHIDAAIIGNDQSVEGWGRRAVGMEAAQALAQVPRWAFVHCQFPIGPFRALDQHIRTRRTTRSRWLREAVAEKWEREGGDLAAIHAVRRMDS